MLFDKKGLLNNWEEEILYIVFLSYGILSQIHSEQFSYFYQMLIFY